MFNFLEIKQISPACRSPILKKLLIFSRNYYSRYLDHCSWFYLTLDYTEEETAVLQSKVKFETQKHDDRQLLFLGNYFWSVLKIFWKISSKFQSFFISFKFQITIILFHSRIYFLFSCQISTQQQEQRAALRRNHWVTEPLIGATELLSDYNK